MCSYYTHFSAPCFSHLMRLISWRSFHIGTWRAAPIFLTPGYYSMTVVGHLHYFWILALTKNVAINNLEYMSFSIFIHSFNRHFLSTYHVLGSNPGGRVRAVNSQKFLPSSSTLSAVSAGYIPRGGIPNQNVSACLSFSR